MSRSADLAARSRRQTRDGGFSMIEIIVSLAIIMMVLVALLPQLVVGIRSTGTARLVTQAKGVAQGQLDRMRNLPFYVSPAAGDYRDVLDFHFRNVQAPGTTPACKTGTKYNVPVTGWTGYVADGGTRCDYEPSGPMYRYVSPTVTDGFSIVVNTQFLSGATPPVAVIPPAAYSTQSTAASRPPATQIGVTVTVLYADRATVKPVSTFSQIAEQPVVTNRIKLGANATAVDVGSATPTDGSVSLSAGLLSLAGSLTYASDVSAALSAVSAGLDTGEQKSGASATLTAPPTRTSSTSTAAAGGLSAGCNLVCWDNSRLDLAAMSSEGGLPNAGNPSSPMQALLPDRFGRVLSFHNTADGGYRPELRLGGPLLSVDDSATKNASGVTSLCAPGASGTSSYVTASGYARSTAMDAPVSPATVEACAVTRTSTMSLFRTDFAPRGVLVVELQRATARCLVTGGTHTASAASDYRAVVMYKDPAATTSDGYTVAATIEPGATTDVLDAIPLLTTPVGGGKYLGDYVASWSSLLPNEVMTTSSAGVASVKLPGVFNLVSQPVRAGIDAGGVDLDSSVSMTFGSVGCSAEDAR